MYFITGSQQKEIELILIATMCLNKSNLITQFLNNNKKGMMFFLTSKNSSLELMEITSLKNIRCLILIE